MEDTTIVIDNGSSMIKAGFAGNTEPEYIFPSIVGHLHYLSSVKKKSKKKDVYIGEDALKNRDKLHLNYPIKHGIITNWDEMEKIWHYTFYDKLHIDPSEHTILITEHAKNPKSNREKMIQIMFESFNIPSFYVAIDSILSLYSSGRTTGLVCDIGDGVSEVFPLYNGYGFPHAVIRQNFGGHDLTNWLGELLNESGYTFTTTAEKEIVREIKEKHTYVALDYEKELQKSQTTNECNVTYTLPDGKEITLSEERFRCPELLFKPHLNGFELDGIDKVIFDSIMKCNIHARKDLYENIVISSGCTMIEGFKKRLDKEIKNLAPSKIKVKIVERSERKYGVWEGGSIFASLCTFPESSITHDEYNECGPAIVHRKCF